MWTPSDTVIVSIVTAASAIVIARINKVKEKTDETYKLVNHRMDEMLKLTQEAYEAIGVKKEHDREK